MKFKTFNKEYFWIKKIIKNLRIEKLIYVSSPAIYLKNHYVGINKHKVEKFLIKNKQKFKLLQIWRPFNLINTDYRKYSNHFHKKSTQFSFLLSGELDFYFAKVDKKSGKLKK